VAVVSARPEAGYNYNAPNRGNQYNTQQAGSSFGGSGFGAGTNSFNGGAVALGGGGGYNGATAGGYSGAASGGYNGATSGGYNGASSGSSSGYNSGISSGAYTGPSSGGFAGGVSSGGYSSGVSSGGFASGVSSGGFATAPQQTLIQKHIYVHVPPPEQEDIRPPQQIQAGVAQKHYKIIFIKAPSPPTVSPAQIALAQQNQEKTIVYVLVKKPDEIGDINIPAVPPTQPSKPEVYFIKYKTQSTGNAGVSASQIGGGSAVGNSFGGSQISSGSATSSIGAPAQSYGPPGQSGPY